VAQPPNDPYGNVIVVDRATGARVPGFPVFRGSLPVGGDGTGGFYVVGGTFAWHRDYALLHVRRDGSIAPSYRVPIRGPVDSAVVSGGTAYLGGRFNSVAGRPRGGMAAVDLRTGRVLAWRPTVGARFLVVGVTDAVVVAIRGFSLHGLNGRTGKLLWSLDPGGGSVEAAATTGHRDFAGGAFEAARMLPSGQRAVVQRAGPLELDARTGRLPWRVRRSVADEIFSLADARGQLFVAGHESGYRVDLRTGRVLGALRGHPTLVQVVGDTLYLGGDLRDMLNIPGRNNIAAVDLRTGRLTRFAPRLTRYQTPGRVIVSGPHVVLSGNFIRSLG
jgi:hypothetical protein